MAWYSTKPKGPTRQDSLVQLVIDNMKLDPKSWGNLTDRTFTNSKGIEIVVYDTRVEINRPIPEELRGEHAIRIKDQLAEVMIAKTTAMVKNPDAGVFADYLADKGYHEASVELRKLS